MNKQAVLAELRQAKTGHIRWRTYAQSITSAPNHLDNIEEKAPVCHTECRFGEWYFNSFKELQHIPGFREIDPLHEQLHQTYRQIFAAMANETKSGTLQRLLGRKGSGNSGRQQEKQIAAAKPLLAQLKATSKELLQALERLEQEITALP